MEMTSSAPLVNGAASSAAVSSRTGRPPVGAAARGGRKARMKNRGSQTCSSDDDDLHSDDNLRPYEEVKVAHHDKKLAGLGLTPDESSVSPIMPSNPSSSRQGSTRSAGRAYSYGSDEEAEARVPLQGRPAGAAHHQPPPPTPQQQQQQQQ
ncbi:uncharacterized protein LOC106014054, partial [Aplysia californica]|uniref:Uncharacterized protein LOC106014054 n=1 Tax=Aplysia californica TaxID=6500 RepID=A0ABM1AF93_APLCA